MASMTDRYVAENERADWDIFIQPRMMSPIMERYRAINKTFNEAVAEAIGGSGWMVAFWQLVEEQE